MLRALPVVLFLSLCACESVRTVYDANGNVVEEKQAGGETDLYSHFEKEFSESFSEKKSDSGVPQSISGRVSSFQKDIDAARGSGKDKQFVTKSFSGSKSYDAISNKFSDANKTFSESNKEFGHKESTMASTDMRPDFMNESHGISHSSRYTGDNRRSAAEGTSSSSDGLRYATTSSRYNNAGPDGYIEERRQNTPEPDIIYYRDYQERTISETKDFIHRNRD
ncbi:MAG: hypothetical protein Q3986_07725 [Akkermansia sp.]|nr:hypothetical protein [Akkermansia sp.]